MTARPIGRLTELLQMLDRGEFDRACNDALAQAIAHLESLPKGQGTAKIMIELSIAYQDGRVDLQPILKSKLPEGQAFGRTPMWVHEGALSVQHPNQVDMFTRDTSVSKASTA